MDKSLAEWLEQYESKTNQRVEFGDGFHLLFIPDKGFIRFLPNKELDILMVKEVCGDGRYWYKLCYDMAKAMKLHKMATFICRNVLWMSRLFGARLRCKTDKCDIYDYKDGGHMEAYPYNNDVAFAIQYLQYE